MNAASAQRAKRVLVTGAAGFLGQGLIDQLARRGVCEVVVAVDVRELPQAQRRPGITYLAQDVRDSALADTVSVHRNRHPGAPGCHRHARQRRQPRLRILG